MFSNVDDLSPDEVQTIVVNALSRLETRRGLAVGYALGADVGSNSRAIHNRRDIEQGIRNMRRLLPSAKRLTIETLRKANAGGSLKPSDWLRISRLIDGVCKIVRCRNLRGTAAVRDDRPSEILVDPDDASYLTSDDEAVFVLAHELMHVAARSGKLDRYIERVAEDASCAAHVTATKDQREDLACDFVAEVVLKRFVALNPTGEAIAIRVSRVMAYETPAERFARAWSDFCASYNGDPGDDEHLSQYQTIRALLALDPDLQSIIPMPCQRGDPVNPPPAGALGIRNR